MELFSVAEVDALEQAIISSYSLPAKNPSSKNYFRDDVAMILYNGWLVDNNDTRLLVYCFKLIRSVMVKHLYLFNGLHQEDVFNSMCIVMLEHFPKYKPTSGRIYTYITLIAHYKLKDIITTNKKHHNRHYELNENWDSPQDTMEAVSTLMDFKIFLTDMKSEAGKTLTSIIDALMSVMHDDSVYHAQDRKMLIAHIYTITKLPEELITHTINMLNDRFLHSVLD